MFNRFFTSLLSKFVNSIDATPEMHFEAGQVLESKGRLDEAISHYDQCIEASPEVSRYTSARARAQFSKGNYNQAKEDADRTLSEDEHDHLAMYIKGLCLEQEGLTNEAIALLEQAATLAPKATEYRTSLETVMNAAGDIPE